MFPFILLFLYQTITLTAVADSDPELNETFSVHLGTPSAGRLSGSDSIASITILSNQDPYGVLTLSTSDGYDVHERERTMYMYIILYCPL